MHVRDSLYIDGAWVSPSGPETLEVIDSTTEEVFATIPAGTPADIDRAVQAAHRAFPGWAATPAKDRSAFLQRIAEGLQARAGEIADVISHEVGMPRNLTEMFQVGLPTGEFADNVQAVRPVVAVRVLVPGAPVVFDFDPDAVIEDRSADGEGAAGVAAG